jgi:hypothetical protein
MISERRHSPSGSFFFPADAAEEGDGEGGAISAGVRGRCAGERGEESVERTLGERGGMP